jgi:broad specificity phosphatase PhoE
MRLFAASPTVADVTEIWASAEVKAQEAAALLGERLGVPVCTEPELHENDRTATGFLPPAEFETVADDFFRYPERRIRGWERAVDAQRRFAAAVDRVLAQARAGDLAIVAHGGVGSLLLCRYLDAPISRTFDQPFQGHVWTFDRDTRQVLSRWTPIAPRHQAQP